MKSWNKMRSQNDFIGCCLAERCLDVGLLFPPDISGCGCW